MFQSEEPEPERVQVKKALTEAITGFASIETWMVVATATGELLRSLSREGLVAVLADAPANPLAVLKDALTS